MAMLQLVGVQQLLFGMCSLCLFQTHLAHHISTQPGQNVTLHCDVIPTYGISWYLQSSEDLKMLLNTEKDKLFGQFHLSYTLEQDHYDITENNSSVGLVITGVRDTDLGLYYCGGRNNTTYIQFGKAITLTFAESRTTAGSLSQPACPPPPAGLSRITVITLTCACLGSVLMSIACVWALCCRMQGTAGPSQTCSDVSTSGQVVQKEDVLTSNPGHHDMVKGNRAAASDSVTYAKVAKGLSTPRKSVKLNTHKGSITNPVYIQCKAPDYSPSWLQDGGTIFH
ncbi:uncharacterized protein LOC143514733 [Brachyhypopomus gauderio]|uniref:uncharacterized protein LOC143514733 n=1 Tax=Brachyhypopomus gauderio TaxID=698409 RepID=UPI004041E9E6